MLRRAVTADCVYTVQALGEFYAAVIRKKLISIEQARETVETIASVFLVVAADRECLTDALHAIESDRLPFWGAMFWATARKAGCSLILTEDFQDGRRLGGVTFVNPFAAHNRVPLDVALPPVE